MHISLFLGNALIEVKDLRNSFEMIVKEATKIYAKWGITDDKFSDKRIRKVKKHFDELCEKRLTEPESRFRVTCLLYTSRCV